MRVMAFDIGLKRIGVAVTDPLQIIATSVGTYSPKDIATYLNEYIKNEPLELFVLGKPLQMDGSNSESYQLVEQFAAWLQTTFPHIPQQWIDERLTSKMASQALFDSGLKKKQRQDKKLLDAVSATLILQTYLQSKS